MRKGELIRLASLPLAVSALVVVGCGQEPQGRKVRLWSVAENGAREPPVRRLVPLRVAVAPVISPRENVGLYRPLLEHISAKLGRPVDLVQRRTYAEVNDLVRYGHADAAFVCDYAFVEGERYFGMEALVVPIVRGQPTYRSYIIVPAESTAQDLADLKGTSFAYTDPLSSAGWLFPTHWLNEMGVDPELFFGRTVFTYSHDNTVKAVAQCLVDGGAVDSLVYDFMVTKDPAYGERTQVIQRSTPLTNPPVVVHPDIDPALRDKLQAVFLSLHRDQEGRAVLAPLMIEQFIVPDTRSYDPVRQTADEARHRIAQNVLRRLRESRDAQKGSDHSTPVGTP